MSFAFLVRPLRFMAIAAGAALPFAAPTPVGGTTVGAPEGADARVVVVLATPLNGRHAETGAEQRRAVEAAMTRPGWTGGGSGGGGGAQFGGHLELQFVDDGCSADGARRAASEAIRGRAAVVIGHPCAAAAAAAAPLYQAAGLLFISAGNRHPALTDRRAGPLIFRASGRDDRQGHDAAAHIAGLAGPSGRVAIIHDRTAMARSIVAAATAGLKSAGPRDVTTIAIVAGESTYAKAVAALSERPPAAILFAGFPAEAAIILRQLRAAGVEAPLLLSASNATRELAAHARDLVDERVQVLRPVGSRSTVANDPPKAASPAQIAAEDAVTALENWFEATRSAASTQAGAVASQLIVASGPRPARFDPNGDIRAASFAPFVWRSDAWVRVETVTVR